MILPKALQFRSVIPHSPQRAVNAPKAARTGIRPRIIVIGASKCIHSRKKKNYDEEEHE